MKNGEQAAHHERISKLKKLAIGAGILIAVFLLGYIPSCLSARQSQQQSVRLEYQLKLAELRGQLGMMSYEINRNNYGMGAQHSTKFFDGLREAINQTEDAALKQKLEAILARRDEITANLTEANPGVKEKIAQMYADFFQMTSAR